MSKFDDVIKKYNERKVSEREQMKNDNAKKELAKKNMNDVINQFRAQLSSMQQELNKHGFKTVINIMDIHPSLEVAKDSRSVKVSYSNQNENLDVTIKTRDIDESKVFHYYIDENGDLYNAKEQFISEHNEADRLDVEDEAVKHLEAILVLF